MATLPTNLKDDILDASVNQRRRYNMITNPDGTVEFEDVTAYIQVGSEYGSGLINETNKQINGKVDDSKIVRDLKTIGAMTQEGFIPDALALKEVNESLVASDNLKFQFATDGEGNYGYLGADDSFIPFRSNLTFTLSAEHSDNNGGWRIARYKFDNSKGIYKKIKFTYWSRGDCQLWVNDTSCYGGVEYDLPQSNVTISVIDISGNWAEATVVLYN